MSGTLASLRGVPKYLTLRVQGSVMNQRVSVLIDSGAIHNFIDAHLVQRRAIPTDTFEGFSVLVPGYRTMQCMHYVLSLSVTMGSYTLVDHFFVVDKPYTNIILGVQWLITLGKVTTDWKDLKMKWVDLKSGKPQMIQGMHTYPSPSTSTQTTEMDLCSGRRDLTVPSLMFMRMLQGTFLSNGKPLGKPLDSDLVWKAPQSAALNLDQGRIGAMRDQVTTLEGLGQPKYEGDLLPASPSPSLFYESAPWEDQPSHKIFWHV